MNRVVVGILLLIGGLLGLFMTACGGFFSLGMIAEAGYRGVLVMSLPSFIFGVLLLLFVWKKFVAWRAQAGTAA